MQGVTLAVAWDTNFIQKSINFSVGPLPMKLTITFKGEVGLEFKMGPLGNGVTNPCEDGTCSTTTACGNGYQLSYGYFVMFKPHGALFLQGDAGLDAVFFEVGVGLEIKIVEIKVPITYEGNMGMAEGHDCFGARLQIEAAGGRIYFYVEAWLFGRSEWQLFYWSGTAWNFPADGFIGKCSDAVGLNFPDEPLPDPLETECQVTTYPEEHGTGNVAYQYTVTSDDTNDDMNDEGSDGGSRWILPAQVQDNVLSVMAAGRCNKVALIDDDVGTSDANHDNNGWIGGQEVGYQAVSLYNLPWDLQNDVQAISIQAAEYDVWQDCCVIMWFEQPDYVGFAQMSIACKPDWQAFTNGDDVCNEWESFRMSEACGKLHIEDYWGPLDKQDTITYTSSQSWLTDDFRNDVWKWWVTKKDGRMLIEDGTSTSASSSLRSYSSLPTVSDEMPKVPKAQARGKFKLESGCWTCVKDRSQLTGAALGETIKTFSWRGNNSTDIPAECGEHPEFSIDVGESHHNHIIQYLHGCIYSLVEC